jgi:hypothetical protein
MKFSLAFIFRFNFKRQKYLFTIKKIPETVVIQSSFGVKVLRLVEKRKKSCFVNNDKLF